MRPFCCPHTSLQILSGRKSLPRTLGGGQVLAPEAVREQYRRRASLGGAAEGEREEGGAAPLRRSAEGADCPVCYEVSGLGGGYHVTSLAPSFAFCPGAVACGCVPRCTS